jgi:hypothetical protein
MKIKQSAYLLSVVFNAALMASFSFSGVAKSSEIISEEAPRPTSSKVTPPTLKDLPRELKMQILSFSTPHDVLVTGRTCIELHEISHAEYLWKGFTQKAKLQKEVEKSKEENKHRKTFLQEAEAGNEQVLKVFGSINKKAWRQPTWYETLNSGEKTFLKTTMTVGGIVGFVGGYLFGNSLNQMNEQGTWSEPTWNTSLPQRSYCEGLVPQELRTEETLQISDKVKTDFFKAGLDAAGEEVKKGNLGVGLISFGLGFLPGLLEGGAKVYKNYKIENHINTCMAEEQAKYDAGYSAYKNQHMFWSIRDYITSTSAGIFAAGFSSLGTMIGYTFGRTMINLKRYFYPFKR